MNNLIIIKPLVFKDKLWKNLADYANNCSWKAGSFLSKQMMSNDFSDWERVFVAINNNNIVGFCTLLKTDCIVDIPYTPFIGFIFVDEKYRGKRYSQQLINFAINYAKGLNFDKVYLISDHIGLYEKYGFVKIDKKPSPWNANIMETIFMHLT